MITRQKITVVLAVMICLILSITAIAAKPSNPFTQYPGTPFGDFDVYATAGVGDVKVNHARHVWSQWLDNDEDGVADNPAVYQELVNKNVVMVLVDDENDSYDRLAQDWIPGVEEGRPYFGAYGTEIFPDAIVDGVVVGPHCGTWEEFFHMVSDEGFASVYPSVFGCYAGTEIADAMDIARGGHFENPVIPGGGYPPEAWYTYDDRTCKYDCMISEYFYWLVGTLLGAHDFYGDIFGSCDDIQGEWIPCNAIELEAIDVAGFALVTNPTYMFPTILPDGHYDP